MGKGDRKSKRGKIWLGTFGKRRPARLKQIQASTVKKKQASKAG